MFAKVSFTILFIGITISVAAQKEALSSKQALQKYDSISAVMNKAFPENEFKTYSRNSFSESQLSTYLSQHFQRMDLLPLIDDEHKIFKLNSYLHSQNWFAAIGFPRETIKSYNAFYLYYKSIEKNLSETDVNNFLVLRSYANSLLADNYAKIGALDSAAIVHRTNIKFSKIKNDIYYPSAINNYGLFFYSVKHELDSALVYFNKAYEITNTQFPEHSLIGSIRDNIADVYMDQKNYNKALPLYAANFEFYKHNINEVTHKIDVPRLISAGAQLIKCNLELNFLDEAKVLYGELEAIINDKRNEEEFHLDSMLEFLTIQEQLLIKQNLYEAAYNAAKEVKKVSDSIQNKAKEADRKWQEELNNVTLDRVALNFKIDHIQKENKIQSQRFKLWLMALVFLLIVVVLVGLFLKRKQDLVNATNKQRIIEQELEYTSLKNKQLKSDIASKKRDLSDFALNLTESQKWAKVLEDKVESIKLATSKDKDLLIKDLEQEIKNKVSFDSDTKDFFERVDKLSDAFYSQLSTRFQGLSKNEIRLCSLIRLKIDSRSISNLQNITMASLNTSRYRLRKKLHLSDEENLDDFIQNL